MTQLMIYHPAGRRSQFMDLPDELILYIFDHVAISNEVLYDLAQVCKRLHELCLSICFARFKIKNPQKQAKVALTDNILQVDGLAVLRLCLSVTALDRLVLKFPPCENDMPSLIRCVNRAGKFIARLQSVDKVVLVFGNDHCCCCSKDGTKIKPREETLKKWSSAMERLLNATLEKACTSLVVKGGRYLGHIFAFRRRTESKLLSPLEAVKTFFTSSRSGEIIEERRPPRVTKGDTWEFRRSEKTRVPLILTQVSTRGRENTKLCSLTIQSMMFLMPPLLQWTISAMQYSQIETLELGSLSINHKCWPAIFDLLENAAPDLTEISFAKVRQIDPVDLLRFLGRFPRLTSLTLNHDVESFDGYSSGSFPDFPKLISLHAPASWVFKLLSAQQRGLECLEYLCITYKLRNDGLTHWMRERPPNPSIPSLLADQLRPVTLCLEVRLGDKPAWKMFEDINAADKTHGPCLELISSITLLVETEFAASDMSFTSVLPQWLALFPALRFLVVTGFNAALTRINLFETLIGLVKARKLHLQSLIINGKEAEFVRNKKPATST